MTSVEQLSALYCSLKVACNWNSKKDKKKTWHCIALQDVPPCLKLHVILILGKNKKNMNCVARCTTVLKIASNSNSEKAIAAFFNTVVREGKIDYFYKLPSGFLSASNSLKPLFPCFEHFYARNFAKIRLRFAIWAFSSLRIQIYFCDKHPLNISWYFGIPHFFVHVTSS